MSSVGPLRSKPVRVEASRRRAADFVLVLVSGGVGNDHEPFCPMTLRTIHWWFKYTHHSPHYLPDSPAILPSITLNQPIDASTRYEVSSCLWFVSFLPPSGFAPHLLSSYLRPLEELDALHERLVHPAQMHQLLLQLLLRHRRRRRRGSGFLRDRRSRRALLLRAWGKR